MAKARPTESERFKKLREMLKFALQSSRDHVDIEAAMKEMYGEDASIFGGSKAAADGSNGGETDNDDNNILRPVFESILDRIHDDMSEYTETLLEQEQVEAKLLRLETLLAQMEIAQDLQRQLDEVDKQSARQSAAVAKRPAQLPDTSDLLRCKTLERLVRERDALQAALTQVEAENQALEQQCHEQLERNRVGLAQVQQSVQSLNQTAHAGSSIG